jgi:hypothetical protein
MRSNGAVSFAGFAGPIETDGRGRLMGASYEQTTPSTIECGNGWIDIEMYPPPLGDLVDIWIASTLTGARTIGRRVAGHRWAGFAKYGHNDKITHYRYQPAPPVDLIDARRQRRAGV